MFSSVLAISCNEPQQLTAPQDTLPIGKVQAITLPGKIKAKPDTFSVFFWPMAKNIGDNWGSLKFSSKDSPYNRLAEISRRVNEKNTLHEDADRGLYRVGLEMQPHVEKQLQLESEKEVVETEFEDIEFEIEELEGDQRKLTSEQKEKSCTTKPKDKDKSLCEEISKKLLKLLEELEEKNLTRDDLELKIMDLEEKVEEINEVLAPYYVKQDEYTNAKSKLVEDIQSLLDSDPSKAQNWQLHLDDKKHSRFKLFQTKKMIRIRSLGTAKQDYSTEDGSIFDIVFAPEGGKLDFKMKEKDGSGNYTGRIWTYKLDGIVIYEKYRFQGDVKILDLNGKEVRWGRVKIEFKFLK